MCWTTELVWNGAEKLSPTGRLHSDFPVRSIFLDSLSHAYTIVNNTGYFSGAL